MCWTPASPRLALASALLLQRVQDLFSWMLSLTLWDGVDSPLLTGHTPCAAATVVGVVSALSSSFSLGWGKADLCYPGVQRLVSITPASSSIKTINRKCCTLLQNPMAPQVLFQDKAKNHCHHLENIAKLPSGNDKFTLNPGDTVPHGISFPITWVHESFTFLLPRTPPPSVFYLYVFMILAQF